jgi:hypothetical protein
MPVVIRAVEVERERQRIRWERAYEATRELERIQQMTDRTRNGPEMVR